MRTVQDGASSFPRNHPLFYFIFLSFSSHVGGGGRDLRKRRDLSTTVDVTSANGRRFSADRGIKARGQRRVALIETLLTPT